MGVNLELPHAREEHARILRIHGDIGTSGVLVDEKRSGPRLAAIGRAKDATLRLRAAGMAQRAGADHIRVPRIDDQARNAAGLFEAHQLQVLPASIDL